MWSPNPGPCVADVLPWGEHPDDVEYEKALKAMPKKIMKKREFTANDKDFDKVAKKMGKIDFCVAIWPLSPYSKNSGIGDESKSFLAVYYESKAERKVLNAFSSAGIDLESAEAEPVDPKSSLAYEQEIMYFPGCVIYKDACGGVKGEGIMFTSAHGEKLFSTVQEEGRSSVTTITTALPPP